MALLSDGKNFSWVKAKVKVRMPMGVKERDKVNALRPMT